MVNKVQIYAKTMHIEYFGLYDLATRNNIYISNHTYVYSFQADLCIYVYSFDKFCMYHMYYILVIGTKNNKKQLSFVRCSGCHSNKSSTQITIGPT